MGQAEVGNKTGRRRGRAARMAARAAPLAEDIRPVRPGLHGGRYRPLLEQEVKRIHRAALDALQQIGLGQAIPSCVDVCTAAGAEIGEDGRLRFPQALVEDVIAKAWRRQPLYGQQEKHDMLPAGDRVYYGTAGAATQVIDLENNNYRDATIRDLYDSARIAETLDNCHFFQRPLTACDIEDSATLDVNTLYASIAGTTKHVGTNFNVPEGAEMGLRFLHRYCGSEEAWRARPFVSNSNCFVVPPMKFAEDACRVLEICVRGGMPVLLLSAGQAGATAPPYLAGAVVQAVAECLAGLCYVNAIKPGAPAIFGTWPFVSDLRTGAMSGGSGEQGLLAAACAQMAQFYDLPGGGASGMCDSKLPDNQAGYEKGINTAVAGLAGLNLVYESIGMHASLLGFCLDSMIIDDDMIGQVLRCVRGIEVTEDSVSLEVIRQVCLEGPGHYLGHEATLSLMQREYVYPVLGDRSSPKEWVEKGKQDLVRRAIARRKEVLANHFPGHVSDRLDVALRRAFPLMLPRSVMRADA
ncbi:MAG: trimethylamine methyltransferase family protein [Rhodospirillales bacterium]|nr:trimethylamine methyltransferase family protein [Rhodospirillales bacterium]